MLADVDVLSAAPGRGAPNPSRTPRTPLQGRGSSPSPRLWQPPFCREGDNGDMGVPPGGVPAEPGDLWMEETSPGQVPAPPRDPRPLRWCRGTRAGYSRRCPASLGAHRDQGLRAPPWHPGGENGHGVN